MRFHPYDPSHPYDNLLLEHNHENENENEMTRSVIRISPGPVCINHT